ncbi:hypothetical protein RRG08_036926 [Elysia crispata]|uniref:Uncharacterized protein n=1 Tax=Elysia crispata TaxID=231223 RepID=A0AAE0ZJ47_9GAST|nr:hypothetical protein RRG08_036926 [Elysia crispata]
MLRDSNPVTKMLPSPEESIEKSNSKKSLNVDLSTPNFGMNVSDVNNLLRRRLSLSLHVSEEDQTGEKGEAIFPQVSTFSEAAPIILSHLVKDSSLESKRRSQMTLDSSSETSRKSSLKVDIEKFRASKGNDLTKMNSMQQKSDSDFLDSLMKTSNFMKEALEKDWSKTKNYVKWVDHYVNSSKYLEKASKSSEKWMVVLYTSSEGAFDELTNFRCMLVRLLLQHHCVVYEERDVQLTQFESEFQERLGGEKTNIPQVFMQGFNVGGYRVMYGIHKQDLANSIFKKFIIPSTEYGEWMFSRENKKSNLTLDVNLKAFPAVQALAGSWANSKLAPHHLEFVTMGKFVVKHARQSWFDLSSRMYGEPDLRRYALLRLTIINALIAMNKVYKQYMNKIDSEGPTKIRRKLSWLPHFSKLKE